MRTAGVDLAAQAAGTALAVIDWTDGGASLQELHLGVDDPRIVEVAASVQKIGIDCAFGWPDEFVSFVTAHASLEPGGSAIDGGLDWRRTLAYRETDRDVRRRTGRWPLSVSTDRLGLTAMRCAGLLARIAESGVAVDRSGAGLVVEVYPGASLRLWGLPTTGYRTEPAARAVLLAALAQAEPRLDLGEHAALMLRSADAFDAVIAALAARSAALGRSGVPPSGSEQRARREGWIALPTCPLSDLV
jgi:predicted nuclease with RNAse H fold